MLFGARGEHVERLQAGLVKRGYKIDVDGIYGSDTEQAVREFQRSRGLIDDGIAGDKTISALSNKVEAGSLGGGHLAIAAERLGVDIASVYAINQVESRGKGFFAPGKPAILYERHIMRRRLIANGQSASGWPESVVSSKPGGYLGGMSEYNRLGVAMGIHKQSALESCSWGAFQVMGFHWKFLGYKSVFEFVERMEQSEAEHFEALVRFIERNPSLHRALKARDWSAFASGYNGKDYWRQGYHHKLAAAYERYGVLLS